MERKWWTLLATCVATFMLLLDITIVNVALPDIQKSLDASFSELQWVVDAYALGLASLLLTAGSLGDRLGRRSVFVAGFAIFTLASLLCGLADDATLLNLARALQGIGGAAMFATTLALIAQEFQGPERATAFGIWGATVGGAVAIGPLVGGLLTEAFGWESIFFVNVPIGIAAIALTLTKLAESRAPDPEPVDWAGAALFSSALFLLVLGLVRGNAEGWASAQILVSLIGSAALMIGFTLRELRTDHPMLDLGLFRKPSFVGVSVVAFSLSAGMFALFLYLTIFMQDVLGYSPLETGVRFLPLTLLSFTVAPISGQLLKRFEPRWFFAAGLGLVGTGLLLMHGVSDDSSWTALLAGFVLAGAGIGLANPAIATVAVGVVPAAKAGMGSGVNTTFRQVGIATGIAGLGAVFQSRIEAGLTERLGSVQHRLVESVASSGPAGAGRSGTPTFDAAHAAFISAFNDLILLAGLLAFAGALIGLVLTRERDMVPQAAPVPAIE
jgi:EmrB/QacA subfamily drug resistance transporter